MSLFVLLVVVIRKNVSDKQSHPGWSSFSPNSKNFCCPSTLDYSSALLTERYQFISGQSGEELGCSLMGIPT